MAEANADGIGYFRLRIDGAVARFHLGNERGEHVVVAGLDGWLEGETTMPGAKLHHGYEPGVMRVVAGGRWLAPGLFEMTWQFVETSFRDTVTLRLEGDRATFNRSVNVNTMPTSRPTLVGRSFKEDAPMVHTALMAIALATQTPPAPAAGQPAYSTTTTTIGELLDTPATRAVLEADAPFVVHHPRIEQGRPYTLADIVQYAPQLTTEVLAKIDAVLARVKRPPVTDKAGS